MFLKRKSLIAKNLGNSAENRTPGLATLDDGSTGVDHWSLSGWIGVLVVLATVVGIVIYFKRKIVELVFY